MNTQKLMSQAISVYRREFQPSQNNRTYSSRGVTPVQSRTDQENEFENELQRALEGFASSETATSLNVEAH